MVTGQDISKFVENLLYTTHYDIEKINTIPTQDLLAAYKAKYRLFLQWYEKGEYDTCYKDLTELTLYGIVLFK